VSEHLNGGGGVGGFPCVGLLLHLYSCSSSNLQVSFECRCQSLVAKAVKGRLSSGYGRGSLASSWASVTFKHPSESCKLEKLKLENMLDKAFEAEASSVVIKFQYWVCLSRESVILIMLFVIIVNLVEVSEDCFSFVLDFVL
jgi:hypothetical protein